MDKLRRTFICQHVSNFEVKVLEIILLISFLPHKGNFVNIKILVKVVLLKVWSQLSVNKNIIFILKYLKNILKW